VEEDNGDYKKQVGHCGEGKWRGKKAQSGQIVHIMVDLGEQSAGETIRQKRKVIKGLAWGNTNNRILG